MGMPDLLYPPYWTADMVRALPDDGQRYELVHGELLVTPAPRGWHQEITFRLARRPADYLDHEPVGHVMLSPADISWDEDTLVQPDLFVVDPVEARAMDWRSMRTMLLVAEVLSPATARQDRFVKRVRYQAAGVAVYWIVDLEHEVVEVWAPADRVPRIECETLQWWPAAATAPFTIQLKDLFRPL